MREFKFRVWDKKHGRMMSGCCNLVLMLDGHLNWDFGGELKWISGLEESYELMQYTGLKDKQGREIYEGDIVHYEYDGYGTDNWQVAWGYDGWIMQRGDRQTGDRNVSDDTHFNNWEETEVIGNIYEHLELMPYA